jgi:hypothetical protein
MVKGNSKIHGAIKGKNKSQLSLKSKAYTRTGNIKNLHNSGSSFDNMGKYSEQYHRHSLPQQPLDFKSNLCHFTPSTNFTISCSEERLSGQKPHMNQSMQMQVLSPVPFEKVQSNSQEAFSSLDSHFGYPKECSGPPNIYFNNTMPLPDMAAFRQGVSYSPDFSMQYPYYNVNTGSTGRISNNSGGDYLQGGLPQQYYEENVGRSWPKIPQNLSGHTQKFSTIPPNYKGKQSGRVITKENDQQK